MRVTHELAKKIRQDLDAKYNPQLMAKQDEIKAIRDKHTVLVLDELHRIGDANPIINKLLASYAKSVFSSERNLESAVRAQLCILSAEAESAVDAIHQETMAICNQRDNEIDKLMIAVSYGKDIEDIKKAFETAGLVF